MKYIDYVDSGKIKSEIGLEDFAKLFLNHRPIIAEQLSELSKVFKIAGQHSDDPGVVPDIRREDFLAFLKTRGETFKERDFVTFFKPLLGGQVEQAEDDMETFNLQSTISYEWFTKEEFYFYKMFPFFIELRSDPDYNESFSFLEPLRD